MDCLTTTNMDFPTHRHSGEFWEALGRAVATYGFLEEVLGKAIFSFTATREISDEQLQAEFERWLPTLQHALSKPLGSLIDSYAEAARANKRAKIVGLDCLFDDLRKAAVLRNVLCHGSWRVPDDHGRTVPLFVDSKNRIFDTAIDIAYLRQVQRHVAELICAVINTVTQMGWQFPGSGGPGIPIIRSQRAGPGKL
jgi:hypothetical protein